MCLPLCHNSASSQSQTQKLLLWLNNFITVRDCYQSNGWSNMHINDREWMKVYICVEAEVSLHFARSLYFIKIVSSTCKTLNTKALDFSSFRCLKVLCNIFQFQGL